MRRGVLYGDDALAHLRRKLDAGEVSVPVGERMLARFRTAAHNPPLSYEQAWWDAVHPCPPAVVYHTAPPDRREQIYVEGLRVCQPGQGGAWAPNKTICRVLQAEQPPGVYVAGEPDWRGVWAHWPAWDVWAIERARLPWENDALNPECWRLCEDVPPEWLQLMTETP